MVWWNDDVCTFFPDFGSNLMFRHLEFKHPWPHSLGRVLAHVILTCMREI